MFKKQSCEQNSRKIKHGRFKSRITSYNVCYTKLLRCQAAPLAKTPAIDSPQLPHFPFVRFCDMMENPILVITSYSIHYTKLYDGITPERQIRAKTVRACLIIFYFFLGGLSYHIHYKKITWDSISDFS